MFSLPYTWNEAKVGRNVALRRAEHLAPLIEAAQRSHSAGSVAQAWTTGRWWGWPARRVRALRRGFRPAPTGTGVLTSPPAEDGSAS
jgi:hypothetical protein